MAKKKNQVRLAKRYSFSLWQIIVVVAAFAILGVYTLTQSNAAPKNGGGKVAATLTVQVIASTTNPDYALMHISGCGYSPEAYITQFNYKYLDSSSGWASFASLPVSQDGCIDYTDKDNGVVLRKFKPGNYTAYITQNFLRKGSGSKPQSVASTTFVIGANGLTQ